MIYINWLVDERITGSSFGLDVVHYNLFSAIGEYQEYTYEKIKQSNFKYFVCKKIWPFKIMPK